MVVCRIYQSSQYDTASTYCSFADDISLIICSLLFHRNGTISNNVCSSSWIFEIQTRLRPGGGDTICLPLRHAANKNVICCRLRAVDVGATSYKARRTEAARQLFATRRYVIYFTHARTHAHTQLWSKIFTARCYTSAILAMALCLSVCPSQVGVLSKRLNESSWFLACELPSTRHTLC